jgi:hypothetical protein
MSEPAFVYVLPPPSILESRGKYPCRIIFSRELAEADGYPSVYALSDPRNSAVIYVGMSARIMTRLQAHCRIYPHARHPSRLDLRKHAICQDGHCVCAFLLRRCKSHAEALEWEQRYIDRYDRSLLNVQKNRWTPQRRMYT